MDCIYCFRENSENGNFEEKNKIEYLFLKNKKNLHSSKALEVFEKITL